MSEESQTIQGEELQPDQKTPSLFRNYVSFAGGAIAIASLASILFLFLIELLQENENPYLGIFTYILFPAILVFGLFVVIAGMIFERQRRRKMSPSEIAAYPVLDLNDPGRRRSFFAFLAFTFSFLFISAFGSYRAYEYTESVTFCGQLCHSVMKPEFVAYQASPHARVRCVECHVGPGAEWYVRSKFSGVRQLYAVTFNRFQRPIPSPVHNLRPASETCEKCHWPEKFFGDQLKVFNHYGYDKDNSLNQTRMLIKTGGGSPSAGPVSGIHWHVNISNEVTYIATDEQRQNIPWVRLKDKNGNVIEYFAGGAEKLTPQQIEQSAKRRMDCVDCHNRPTHIYVSPDRAVDNSFVAGKLDVSLPYLKLKAVEILSKPYNTTNEALSSISSSLDEYYRTGHADVYANKRDSINASVKEIQRIYQTYFFPEMKTNWQIHPDNVGHYYFQGCFRCHDGQHFSNTGQVIRNDCNICHTTLDQRFDGKTITLSDGSFQHPVKLGDKETLQCAVCHKGDMQFKHPLELGDISQFQCVECHKGQNSKQAW